MAYEKISYELDGNTAIISFNDPSTMNACGIDTAQELLHAFETARNEARCTILTGKGRGFCSGANLRQERLFPAGLPAHRPRA